MKQKMKLKEKLAIEHAKKFPNWDYNIIAKESFLIALQTYCPMLFNEEVEVDFLDGAHQLTPLQLHKKDVE